MNFEWYSSFIAIYQAGTVSKAADIRFLTQPAISQHLAALENAMHASLFIRQARHMQPTALGTLLYRKIIGAIELLQSIPGDFDVTAQKIFRIGTPMAFFHENVLPYLNQKFFSQLRFQIQYGHTSDDVIGNLLEHKLDMVITTQHIPHPLLHYHKITQENFYILVPAAYVIPRLPTIDSKIHWLEQQPWIVLSEDLPIVRRYWQQLFKRRPLITSKMIVPDLLSVVKAIETGLGISIVPDYLYTKSANPSLTKVIWKKLGKVNNSIYFVVHKSNINTAMVKHFLHLFPY